MTLAVSSEAVSIARDLELDASRVESTISLLDAGNTIPFITRYRRDLTGAMDEEQIRTIKLGLERYRALEERKGTILKSIEAQGKLDDEIRVAIEQARSIKRLEDLYLPYKPRKQTLATLARQRGFEPLANEILEGNHSAETLAQAALALVRVDRGVQSIEEVYQGIGHLIAERFGEDIELRSVLRRLMWKTGRLVTTKIAPVSKEEAGTKEAASLTVGASESSAPEPPAAEATDLQESRISEEQLAPGATESRSLHAVSSEAVSSEAVPSEAVLSEAVASEPVIEPVIEPVQEALSSGPATSAELVTSEREVALEDVITGQGAAISDMPAEPMVTTRPLPQAPVTEEASKRKRKKRNKKKEEERGEFEDYFDFSEGLKKLPPHRVLAINRGEKAKAIRARIVFDDAAALNEGKRRLIREDHALRDLLEVWLKDALHRLMVPSLEREIRRELTEHAESHAVSVFATNLRNLLLQPPVHEGTVLALDPGYKRGCQVAVVGATGTPLESQVIFVVGNGDRRRRGRTWLAEVAKRHGVKVVAIGNGTASREAEKLVADLLENEWKDSGIAYVMVNEAGASVYSTSPLGREELPKLDPTLRSAVSIGRRLLDPLSELVKISAEHLGVGMYQHDVKAKHLRESLDAVVESCVNFVGVDANTASPALLRYVSGLNQLSAKRFVEYRNEHGPFKSRREFSEVPGFGEATFVQAAGFLKIGSGEHPFDATWIHPESYAVAERVLEKLGYSIEHVGRLLRGRRGEGASEPVVEAANAKVSSADELVDVSTAPPEEGLKTDGSVVSEVVAGESQAAEPVERGPQAVATSGEASLSAEEYSAFEQRILEADVERLSTELQTGGLLIRDILANLLRPGRDPREALPPPIFRTGATRIEDLEPGTPLEGRILNVVDFGVFVDIGLAKSGLVHISHLSSDFVKDPHQRFAVGQSIRVWVLEVDKSRRRVSLTAIDPSEPVVDRSRSFRHGQHGEGEGQRTGGPSRERRDRRPRNEARRPPAGNGRAAGSQANASGGRTSGGAPQQGSAGQGSSGQRGSGAGRGPRPNRGRAEQPARGSRGPTRPSKPAPPRKPVAPLKPEVAEGKAPMRSFTELMQFYHQRRDEG